MPLYFEEYFIKHLQDPSILHDIFPSRLKTLIFLGMLLQAALWSQYFEKILFKYILGPRIFMNTFP